MRVITVSLCVNLCEAEVCLNRCTTVPDWCGEIIQIWIFVGKLITTTAFNFLTTTIPQGMFCRLQIVFAEKDKL